VQPYAVQASYGGPEGLRRLVDSAHRHGIAVVLDVVYNHLGPEGNYLGEFGPYFTDKYHTPWGSAINYDDRGSDEVRRLVVDNARYWISEYHIDGLRLDAIHGIFDFSPRHVLADVADAARSVGAAQGRTVVVIGESDMNDPRVLRDVSQGGYGLDGQWADDLHHAIHASLTGETRGYYSDFGQAAQVADGFRTPFIFRGQHSPYRGRRHGAPAEGFSRDRFVVASQNHDQVGNRAAGDRLTTLLDPARLRLASALVLLSPYVPLLFMGEEYGETAPFQYFISHSDPELVKAVQQGRRREFESFGWADDVPDPQAEDTFRRSKLNWDERNRGDHARIMAMYRDLLRLRRMEPALRPGQSAIEVLDNGRAFAAMMKPEGAKYLLAVFNVSDSMMKLQLPGDGWRTIFDAHDEAYGAAAGMKHPRQLRSVGGAVRCELRPYAALLLEPEHA
jgi:maltooligosyltrehalose trehalohydrolase